MTISEPTALLMATLTVAVVVGCAPQRPSPDVDDGQCAAVSARRSGIVMAGSGSNLPLVRALVRRFDPNGEANIHVPESIGTSGAIRAVEDGAIDVGLASRPLTAAELQRADLVTTPLARSVVAFVTTQKSIALTRAQLEAIFTGATLTWADGTPIVPLLREPGDSSNVAIARAWPSLHDAMEAHRAAGGLVFHTDQEMARALEAIEGSIGLLDLGVVHLGQYPLELVTLDGVIPSVQNANAGAWPAVKPLYFLTRGPPEGKTRQFIEFTSKSLNTPLMEAYGYLRF